MANIQVNFDTETKTFNVTRDGVDVGDVEHVSFWSLDTGKAMMDVNMRAQESGEGETIFTRVSAKNKI